MSHTLKKITRQIIQQKKYGRYKYLFSIDIKDVISIGIQNFYYIYFKLKKIEESRELIKYFRLENKNFKEYFNNNKEKIIVKINQEDINLNNLRLLKILKEKIPDIQILFKIEIDKIGINIDLQKEIDKLNDLVYYIISDYNLNDLNKIKKNKSIFKDKDIYLSLDKINNQEKLNNKILFEIIDIFKKNKSFVNLDFIRLESAYKKLYAIGPKELHLDLSEYCNAKCNFCFTNGPGFLNERSDKENNYKQIFSAEKYLELFKGISKGFTESIALGITGEPFMHPEINKILLGLKDINLSIGFLTNGYKLLENIDNIIENKNIKHFYINISSGNLESFIATRPGDDFNNFLNVWKAIKIIQENRHDILIRGLYVITPENINGIDDFIKLSIKNNISEIELKRVVPYEFSNKKFFFKKKDINKVISIIKENKKYFKENKTLVNENFDYIMNDFEEIKKGISFQNPEDEKLDKSLLIGKTLNCYNPYFYISIFRNGSYTCGKFEGKIGKLTNLDLYEQLFEKNEIKNIIKSSVNLKNFLGETKWKEKCSRCHHMDVNNMVAEYMKIKDLSLNDEL